ncbi:ankyrin repeat domain-containing protein [Micromonospora sp. NBC_01796]|uniref:ankyrin repeat domain-containing protein n=1 Tax=Micromonospora sp. NBC_01796 TaxID=2975987 RepID=UPI002DD93130|nr:hypothetical protein [Micromonospora sp. NBC_01796]WSA88171.1 hypothetical protein OIE47_11455 [Micromonospora sp. NBC_01796]
MPPEDADRSFPADHAASWRRIRRYAVPRSMIEEATRCRLDGDWRAACAAANVDVELDLPALTVSYGSTVAAAIEEDLPQLVPDLVRWHLPRVLYGGSTIAPHQVVLLAAYPPEPGRSRKLPYLHLRLPDSPHGSQRLTLTVGPVDRTARIGRYGPTVAHLIQDWTGARHLWHAGHTDELRERVGGDVRVPFFRSDGTPVDETAILDSGPGEGPAAFTEYVTALHERGRVVEALAAAGIDLEPGEPGRPGYRYARDPLGRLARLPVALTRLRPEADRLARTTGAQRFQVRHGWPGDLFVERGDRLRIRVLYDVRDIEAPVLPEASWRRLPDLDLLRRGMIDADRLHPLVRTALFPDLAPSGGPVGPPDASLPTPVRVRCGGEWHEVCFADGELRIPHDEEDPARDGGTGCVAVRRTWRDGVGRLPRGLRSQRDELLELVRHGDVHGVSRLLDAGVDPRVRDGRRRSLLHLLHLVDHTVLLPRLLSAGLDLEARDQDGRTPLFAAIDGGGSAALVKALLGGGARYVGDRTGGSIGALLRSRGRGDLADLLDDGGSDGSA